MKDSYLITGATGFIGSVLVRALIKNQEKVSVITRKKSIGWRLEDIKSKINIYESGLSSPSLLSIITKIKPTVVYHLAAYGTRPNQTNFNLLVNTNIIGTYNLLEAIKNSSVKLFIHGGSSSEYGVKKNIMNESDVLQPLDNYGVTKMTATLLCQKYATTEKQSIATFRLFSPYGYYEDKTRLVPYVILNALLGKDIILSNPKNVRDFVFIQDVVDALIGSVKKSDKINGEIINISSGTQSTLKDVVDIVLQETTSQSKVIWKAHAEKRIVFEPKRWQGDIAKAKKLLKWTPENDLKSGLIKTIDWFRENIDRYIE